MVKVILYKTHCVYLNTNPKRYAKSVNSMYLAMKTLLYNLRWRHDGAFRIKLYLDS
jgi:hypothetical protein